MTDSAPNNNTAWYVIRTRPKQEFRALEQLQNQGFRCFLPTLEVEKIRRGKREIDAEPLFLRYLFIQLNSASSNWGVIRSTRGVSSLVAFGGAFATLPSDLVEALRDAPKTLPQPMFEPGQRIVITSGPFIGLEGIYQMADGEARALILLELMSKYQKLSIATDVLGKTA